MTFRPTSLHHVPRGLLVAIVLAAIAALPWVVNLFGWNLYLSVRFGLTDLNLSSRSGSAHVVLYDRDGLAAFDLKSLYELTHSTFQGVTLLDFDFLDFFAMSRSDKMSIIGFKFSHDSRRTDVEFPWLLVALMPLFIYSLIRLFWLSSKRKRASRDHTPKIT